MSNTIRHTLQKKKGMVRQYLQKFTGYSRAQLTRLIGQYIKRGVIQKGIPRVKKVPKKRNDNVYYCRLILGLENTPP